MPSEPDNKMDELLKAYAKKRRAETGGEMHPATRRLLQAEVAKLRPAPAPERKSWLALLGMYWPRVAVAAAVVAVGGIAMMSLFPPPSEKQETMFLAKQDKETPSADRYIRDESVVLSRRSLAPAVAPPAKPVDLPTVALSDETKSVNELRRENAPASPRAVVAERDLGEMEKAGKKMKPAEPARAPAPTAAPIEVARSSAAASGPATPATQLPVSEPVSLGVALAELKDKDVAGGREAAPQTPPPGLVAADGAVVFDSKQVDALAAFKATAPAGQQQAAPKNITDLSSQSAVELKQQLNNATVRSRFAQVQNAGRPARGKALPNSEAAVLTTFFVEQTGEQVRVVDGDGSIYEGKIVNGDVAGTKEAEDLIRAPLPERQDESRVGRNLTEQEVRQQQTQRTFNLQAANNPPAPAWNFRATGMNRTLKQPVTIDAVVYESVTVTNVTGAAGTVTAGQSPNFYRETPGQAPAKQLGYTVTTTPAQAAGGAVLQNNAYNSQSLNVNNALRIQGNYRIGPTNQRPLDAVRDGNSR